MVTEIKKDAAMRMNKSIDTLKLELSKLRTGRANASLLDHVNVSYYGSNVPLNQVASVSSDGQVALAEPESRTRIVSLSYDEDRHCLDR